MAQKQFSPEALERIQELIESNFSGRDELYAAAESLDDAARQRVCRRLAQHLAGHAAHLQQIVSASGTDPAGPLDLEAIAAALFDLARMHSGERGVLKAAAEGESNLKQDYDRAIHATDDRDTEDLLKRQRKQVEFGEQVLRGMGADGHDADSSQSSGR